MVELLFTTSVIWTVPGDWTNQNIIEIYAGGGGATGPYFFGSPAGGSVLVGPFGNSGLAGGYNFTRNLTNLIPGDQIEINVGQAGSGGVGAGVLITSRPSPNSAFINRRFQSFDWLGQYGGNTSLRRTNGNIILNATGGGPGSVTYVSDSITVSPFTIFATIPGPDQPGAPLRLWNSSDGVSSPNRYTRYPPISDGALVKLGTNYGAGGAPSPVISSTFVQQSGSNGIVAISYVSRTTHSPCVWIS
jgi:hypothetical protein